MKIAFYSYKSYDRPWFDKLVDPVEFAIEYIRGKLDANSAYNA